MALKPGRYISIEKGPSAVSEPNMRISTVYFCLVIFIWSMVNRPWSMVVLDLLYVSDFSKPRQLSMDHRL